MQDSPVYRFGEFTLDVENRELLREGEALDLNARYFDALLLLVREHGRLVDKDRFFEKVWDEVVVSDSALTQCIKEIRRELGDDASDPRFIRTVPGHGYRFIGEVTTADESAAPEASDPFSEALASTLAGTLGGAGAGLLGGLLYGIGIAYAPINQELGTVSVLIVLISLAVFLGTVGAFGISAGMAGADYAGDGHPNWRIAGAVVGGMLIGGSVKLLGVDAFNLFFGRTPAGITGGMEGAGLGLAVGLGARLGGGLDAQKWWLPVASASATGAVAGVAIALLGGHLLGGSLDLLAQSFSDSRVQLDAFGRYLGDVRFGGTTQIVLAGIEGLTFVGCVVGALVASRFSRKPLARGD